MEWYMKNRWWIWSVTGVYLAYRILTSILPKLLPFELKIILLPPFLNQRNDSYFIYCRVVLPKLSISN